MVFFELQGDKVMQSLALSEGSLQMEHVEHVLTVRLRQKEALGDVLVLDLVVIRLSVKLGKS